MNNILNIQNSFLWPCLFIIFKLSPANYFMIDFDEEYHWNPKHNLSAGNTHQLIQPKYWGKVSTFENGGAALVHFDPSTNF